MQRAWEYDVLIRKRVLGGRGEEGRDTETEKRGKERGREGGERERGQG